MKKFLRVIPKLCVAFLLFFLLQGCLKDTYSESFKIYVPVYKTLTEVRADMKSGPVQDLQNPGKLNVFGNYIFLNEMGKGIHVIDNTNPSAPRKVSFINIPANLDLAVKGRYLYADSYSDVVVFDISQPTSIKAVGFLNNVIKERNRYWYSNQANADSILVVVGYQERDTTVSYHQYRRWESCPRCMVATADLKSHFYTTAPQVGMGGSMARFTIVNDFLYAVSNSELYAINISEGDAPQLSSTKNLGWNIETVYPFQDKLFIGSRTGMFIYSLSNPAEPTQAGQFTHVNSCDPVIADEQYAYVTLRSGTTCNGFTNQLEVLDIRNLASPVLVQTVPMSNPHGLSKDGDKLFICDGSSGLKLFDASTPTKVKQVKAYTGIETYDVIAFGGKAIVVAKDGLYQFDYSGNNELSPISKLPIQKN